MNLAINAQLIDVLAVKNKLGEGVVWDSRDQSLWWTDILDKKLYHLCWQSRALKIYSCPEKVCSFGLTKDPKTLLVAFEHGLAFYQPESQAIDIKWQHKLCAEQSGIRLNDGRMDRQGRFWVGSMVEEASESSKQRGKLYCFDAHGKIEQHLSDILISNSLCWSVDSRQMYFADSATNSIMVYDFDTDTGIPSNPRMFAKTDSSIFPDGSDIDSEGNLWNAQWDSSRITCYAPSGEVKDHLDLPISQPTCIAFGGPDLDLLFITSSAHYLSKQEAIKQPLAGNLLIYKIPSQGLDATIYAGEIEVIS